MDHFKTIAKRIWIMYLIIMGSLDWYIGRYIGRYSPSIARYSIEYRSIYRSSINRCIDRYSYRSIYLAILVTIPKDNEKYDLVVIRLLVISIVRFAERRKLTKTRFLLLFIIVKFEAFSFGKLPDMTFTSYLYLMIYLPNLDFLQYASP